MRETLFQHVAFLIGRMIDWMVPDVPEEVEIKIKREYYMAKEALAENQVNMSQMMIYLLFISSKMCLIKSVILCVDMKALGAAVETSELRRRVKSKSSTASPDDTGSLLPSVTAEDISGNP